MVFSLFSKIIKAPLCFYRILLLSLMQHLLWGLPYYVVGNWVDAGFFLTAH